MNRLLAVSTGLALALTAVTGVAQETSARTVQYHSQDIVPIHQPRYFSHPSLRSLTRFDQIAKDDLALSGS